MSFEINILSVGQKTPVFFLGRSGLMLRNERTCADVRRYFKIWPVFSHTEGILYSADVEEKPGFYWSFPVCDSDSEAGPPRDLPEWIPPETASNLTPLLIRDVYNGDLEAAVDLLIRTSPAGTVLFQTRYQDGDREVLSGTLKKTDFFRRLRTRRLLFNVCYAVTEDG